MNDAETVMSGTSNESIEIILVRMEGKIDRFADRMGRFEDDITGLRARMHDLSNTVTPITMLDLGARIRTTDQNNAKVDTRIQALEDLEQRRMGAQATIKILWGILGAVGVGGVAAVLRLLQVGGI